jgi:hypothetical protein
MSQNRRAFAPADLQKACGLFGRDDDYDRQFGGYDQLEEELHC